MKADLEPLVALALVGALDEDQTLEILENVYFAPETAEAFWLNQICRHLREQTPMERLARCHREE